jgi:hypothetical protein
MKMIFSAASNNKWLDGLIELGATSFLFSFENKGVIKQVRYLSTKYADRKFLILIDSGAFSVFNRGMKLDLDLYCQFIEKVKAVPTPHEIYFINVDVIPQAKGTTPTAAEIERACEQGLENYMKLRSRGHNTLHTFHQFDDFKYLDIIRNECDTDHYICISPANDQSLESRTHWLREVTKQIKTTTRTHCLGLTAHKILEQLPVFSADSSTWRAGARYGVVFDWENFVMMKKQDLTTSNCIFYDPKNHCYDATRYHLNIETHLTRIWDERGVIWPTA